MGEWGERPSYTKDQQAGMQEEVNRIKNNPATEQRSRGGMSQAQIEAAQKATQESIAQVRAGIAADANPSERDAAAHSDQMEQATVKGRGVTNAQVERQNVLTGKALENKTGQ